MIPYCIPGSYCRASGFFFFYLVPSSFLFEIPNKKEEGTFQAPDSKKRGMHFPDPGSQIRKRKALSWPPILKRKRGRHFPGPRFSKKKEEGTFQARDLKKK